MPRYRRGNPCFRWDGQYDKATVPWRTFLRCVAVAMYLLSLTGCQSEDVWTLDPTQPEECPYSETQESVTLAAWPWTNHGEVKKQFSVDLLNKHVLPIQVVIANRSQETVRVSSTQIQLVFQDYGTESVLSEGEMSRRTRKNSGTAPFLITVGTLGFGAPVSAAMGTSLEDDNRRMRNARKATYLSTVVLDAQEHMSGFLFFDIPREIKLKRDTVIQATLVIRRLPIGSGGSLSFRLPVTIQRQ